MAFRKPELHIIETENAPSEIIKFVHQTSLNQSENSEAFLTSLDPGNSRLQPVRKATNSHEFKEGFIEAVKKHPVFECQVDLESPRTLQAMQRLHLKPEDIQLKYIWTLRFLISYTTSKGTSQHSSRLRAMTSLQK